LGEALVWACLVLSPFLEVVGNVYYYILAIVDIPIAFFMCLSGTQSDYHVELWLVIEECFQGLDHNIQPEEVLEVIRFLLFKCLTGRSLGSIDLLQTLQKYLIHKVQHQHRPWVFLKHLHTMSINASKAIYNIFTSYVTQDGFHRFNSPF
jgi:hypothetical protein